LNISTSIKQKNFSSPHEMALINVLFTSNWLRDKQKEYFHPYDLKAQHFNVLRILKGKYPEASCPGDIKDVMLDKSPDLTRLIDKMIAMGLVDRNVCQENRRKVDVIITKKGLDIVNDISSKMNSLYDAWAEKLSNEEAEKLSDLLDKIRS
jgi:DNA-binding MarR family transcriptional regulator